MNRSLIGLTLGCCLTVPSLAAAQAPLTTPPGVTYRGAGDELSITYPPSNLKQMYEDIEILRRLLNRDLLSHRMGQMSQCTRCHANPFSDKTFAFSPDGKVLASQNNVVRLWDTATGKQLSAHHGEAHPFTGAEGTYLKGVGVLYTITLPPLPENPHAPPAKATTKALSDWDRVRKQLQGEKVDPLTAPERSEPTLSEVVLKTLADNGRHFTQLGTTEGLTVVITFRGSEPAPVKTTSGNRTGIYGPTRSGQNPTGDAAGLAALAQSALTAGATTAGAPANPSSARDYELLADLQLKQGRAQEAIMGYKKAVELSSAAKELVALYRKLAQAYLVREQDGPAREAMEKGLQYLKAFQKEGSATAKTTGLAAALPSQLIISVPQPRLHQFASGTLTFEQFRRAAQVELRTFSGAETKTSTEPHK